MSGVRLASSRLPLNLKRDVIALLVIVAVWLAFFWRLFTPAEADRVQFASGDFTLQFLAFRRLGLSELQQGRWPLWLPCVDSGYPYFADPQAASFYPPAWLSYAGHLIRGTSEFSLPAINLSGASLGNEEFLAFVHSRIIENGIDPGRLCFEITETAAIANLAEAMHFMGVLKKMGCCFSLDDFGSGLSSFTYLKNLPVDYLKIDGSFIRDVVDDPHDRAMVEAITRVGHVMGLKTIAEYVESRSILELLRFIGIDYSQGHAIEVPRPLVTMPEKLSWPRKSIVNS